MGKTYNISRYELNKDNAGEIISGFLAVSVSDGENGSYFEHWMSSEELASVLANEANLKPILAKCYAEAELKMENEIANRPQPSIYPLELKGKKAILEALVKAKDVTDKKLQIKSNLVKS